MEMQATPASTIDGELTSFRHVLNEYDIVANGIRSLKNQLKGRDGDLFSAISGQLEKIGNAYRIDRDRLWLMQVGDETLYVLRDELQRRARGGDPLAELSVEVEKLSLPSRRWR